MFHHIKNIYILFILNNIALINPCFASDNNIARHEYAASIFQERCTLCHGKQGMGDGILPLSMEKYPSTNLHNLNKTLNKTNIKKYLIYGGTTGKKHHYSPPWGQELSNKEIDLLANFVLFLQQNPKESIDLLNKIPESYSNIDINTGKAIYHSRCGQCHGNNGLGDGELRQVINNPPPFNLSKSRASQNYLLEIITNGGESMGRSPMMPPWREELSLMEIHSVIVYIKTLRK